MAHDASEAEEKWPKVLPMSDRVTATVGFADDRVKITVKTGLPWPAPSEVSLWLTAKDMPLVEEVLRAQKQWLEKPEYVRQVTGATK